MLKAQIATNSCSVRKEAREFHFVHSNVHDRNQGALANLGGEEVSVLTF